MPVRCALETEPALVPLEIVNCSVVNSQVGIRCTAKDENYPATLRIANSILWGNNVDIEHDYPRIQPVRCDIKSGWPGGGDNVSSDPLFVDPSDRDFHLRAGSPCVDAGKNEVWMWDAVDLDGNPRVWGDIVDMGA